MAFYTIPYTCRVCGKQQLTGNWDKEEKCPECGCPIYGEVPPPFMTLEEQAKAKAEKNNQ